MDEKMIEQVIELQYYTSPILEDIFAKRAEQAPYGLFSEMAEKFLAMDHDERRGFNKAVEMLLGRTMTQIASEAVQEERKVA